MHEFDGNFTEAHLIRHTQINITCTKDNRFFDFVMLVNTNIASLGVDQILFDKCRCFGGMSLVYHLRRRKRQITVRKKMIKEKLGTVRLLAIRFAKNYNISGNYKC